MCKVFIESFMVKNWSYCSYSTTLCEKNLYWYMSVFLQSYDNGDSQLDSSELLKFIQHNESVVELQSYADQESNKLLRSVFVGLHAHVTAGGKRTAVCIFFCCIITLRLFKTIVCEHFLLW